MAIDLFVMPLARYWSGDYITPTMRAAWQLAIPYSVITPSGRIDLPPGQPYGGPEAADQRRAMVADAPAFFASLRAVSAEPPWDESDDGDIGDWRVDPRSFASLLAQIDGELGRSPGFFGRAFGQKGYAPQVRSAWEYVSAR